MLTFESDFKKAIEYYKSEITKALFSKFKDTAPLQIESLLSDYLFENLNGLPLVDKYQHYQAFNNDWKIISTDLEIIQTEGFNATKQVDPYMVQKSVNGKKTEVQYGWCGHILPFDLVQKNYFEEELNKISTFENRMEEIESLQKELIEDLGDDKVKSFVNSDEDGFVKSE